MYSNVIDSLMYVMVCMGPDISHAVGVVSMYLQDPGKRHWQVVKWILRYLLKIEDISLAFEWDNTLGQCVIDYVDYDYADN